MCGNACEGDGGDAWERRYVCRCIAVHAVWAAQKVADATDREKEIKELEIKTKKRAWCNQAKTLDKLLKENPYIRKKSNGVLYISDC